MGNGDGESILRTTGLYVLLIAAIMGFAAAAQTVQSSMIRF